MPNATDAYADALTARHALCAFSGDERSCEFTALEADLAHAYAAVPNARITNPEDALALLEFALIDPDDTDCHRALVAVWEWLANQLN